MSWKASRKFWQEACVAEAEGGYRVLLDDRELRTPSKALLILPTRALAEGVAAEWAAQGDKINPATMPLTRAANSAIEKVVPQYDEVAAMLAEYGGSDLLCYRAESPVELIAVQAEAWDPWLDWARRELGAPLLAIQGVIHHPQDAASLARLAEHVRGYAAFELTGLHDLVTLSGSLILGLAVARQALKAEAAWDLSRVDETWQAALWGRDDEAEALAGAKRQDFVQAARLLALLGDDKDDDPLR